MKIYKLHFVVAHPNGVGIQPTTPHHFNPGSVLMCLQKIISECFHMCVESRSCYPYVLSVTEAFTASDLRLLSVVWVSGTHEFLSDTKCFDLRQKVPPSSHWQQDKRCRMIQHNQTPSSHHICLTDAITQV